MATIFVIINPNYYISAQNTITRLEQDLPVIDFVVNEIDHRTDNINWWEHTHSEIYASSLVLLFADNDEKNFNFTLAHLQLAQRFKKHVVGILLSNSQLQTPTFDNSIEWIPQNRNSDIEYIVNVIERVLDEESTYSLGRQKKTIMLRDPDDIAPQPTIPSPSLRRYRRSLAMIAAIFVIVFWVITTVAANQEPMITDITPENVSFVTQVGINTVTNIPTIVPEVQILSTNLPTQTSPTSIAIQIPSTSIIIVTNTRVPATPITLITATQIPPTPIIIVTNTLFPTSTSTATLVPTLSNQDTDNDGVLDQYDACVTQAGEPETQGCSYLGTIITTGGNYALVRSAATQSTRADDRLANGTRVTLIGINQAGTWYHIRYQADGDVLTGWVNYMLISTPHTNQLPRE